MQDELGHIEVFPWNDNFETGVSLVDDQHKKLIDLLNELAIDLAYDYGEIELNHVVDKLADYADFHFHAEEKVWGSYFGEDEWLTGHKGGHGAFISKVAALRDGKSESNKKEFEGIVRYLIHWLAHHILENDMRMAKVVHAMDEGCDLAHAKQRSIREMGGAIPIFIETLLGMYGSLSSLTLALMREKMERIKIGEALKLSEQHEREFSDKVITSIPGLLYLYDDQFRLMRWNKRHADELGYTDAELKGKSALDFFEESKHEKIRNALAPLSLGEEVEIEEEVRGKDGGETPYLLTGVPLDIDGKHCFLGTGINISPLKRAEQELERTTQESKNALIGTVVAVSKAMEARDPYTAGHQQRVADIAVAIAEKLGLDEHRLEGLRLGSIVHDLGKLAIPVELLVKPKRLTPLEYSVIQTHAQAGAEILKGVSFPWPILEIVSQHHERLDGSGYPFGLKGEEICLEVRIVAVADVFEAMSSHRPYRPSMGVDPAVEELKRNCGKFYDAKVVDALLQLLEEDVERFSIKH